MGYCARKPFAGPNVWLEQKVIQRYTPEGVQVDIRDSGHSVWLPEPGDHLASPGYRIASPQSYYN